MDQSGNYSHEDILAFLNSKGTLKEKLVAAHQVVQQHLPFIARIALTLYDPDTHLLKTYMHSSGEDNPLEHYQALLDNAPSLREILKRGKPRVINNMEPANDSSSEHARRLAAQGYLSSYTLPMFNDGTFVGFLFFDSYESSVFSEQVMAQLDVYAHLISLVVDTELSSLRTLTAAVKTTGHITHMRDPETGAHLERMARYSRLIARELADKYELDDEYIEHVFMFAPLHDVGKIAIPDRILLKPGRLTGEERKIMQTHASLGMEIIDDLIRNFGLEELRHVDILRNIAASHHEAVNGTGYPLGKLGDEIPLEARIVAVADIFDALTSTRPYKKAWSNSEAFAALKELVDEKLDRDCVEALISHQSEVEEIQETFRDSATND